MPSGAYNRYEAIKTMLTRQKMIIVLAEKHLTSHFENPGAVELPEGFAQMVLEELDKVEMHEIFSGDVFFLDKGMQLFFYSFFKEILFLASNDKMQNFLAQFVSEVDEEVPLIGNVLQVRHLVPSDYFKLSSMTASNNVEIQRLISMQQNVFASDQMIDVGYCTILFCISNFLILGKNFGSSFDYFAISSSFSRSHQSSSKRN